MMYTIALARKPCGPVVGGVQVHGAGALQIDLCRINTGDNLNGGAYATAGTDRWDGSANWRYKRLGGAGEYVQPSGRWPANLVLIEGAPMADLDAQTVGLLPQGAPKRRDTGDLSAFGGGAVSTFYGDTGGASRFFKVIQP